MINEPQQTKSVARNTDQENIDELVLSTFLTFFWSHRMNCKKLFTTIRKLGVNSKLLYLLRNETENALLVYLPIFSWARHATQTTHASSLFQSWDGQR